MLISVHSEKLSVNDMETRLRCLAVPIVARISEDELLLDLRTVDEGEFAAIRKGMENIITVGPRSGSEVG
jgi:L-seryl-tRNA(Ser) seleniumtransferase